MAGGLIGLGRQGYLNQANAGFGQAAGLETQRRNANRRLEQAEQQQTMSAVGTGAGAGMAYGLSSGTAVGGPAGAVIGAGVGYLAGELL
jgi:amino acid permease